MLIRQESWIKITLFLLDIITWLLDRSLLIVIRIWLYSWLVHVVVINMHVVWFQACISEVTATYDRQLLFKSNERFIIQIQARIRGFLSRRLFHKRMSFMHTQLPAIVFIQVGRLCNTYKQVFLKL